RWPVGPTVLYRLALATPASRRRRSIPTARMPSVENRRMAVARSRSRGPGLVDRVLVTQHRLSARRGNDAGPVPPSAAPAPAGLSLRRGAARRPAPALAGRPDRPHRPGGTRRAPPVPALV